MGPHDPTAFTLRDPERFLRLLGQHPRELDLSEVSLTEVWALVALAAPARIETPDALRLEWGANERARGFAAAVGLEEVIRGAAGGRAGEAGRTVRLSRVLGEEDIEPAAREIALLLAGEAGPRQSARWTMQYVVTELLRNVIQHSDDPLGGVVGAQLNDRGLHAARPVYQVAVADHGQGILASLSRTHLELDHDAVAIERALWPYVSGAFHPGRAGGVENAGLGLFYISEMAKGLEGRLLVASGQSALFIDPIGTGRQRVLPCGYAGTLVAFEVPAETPREFGALFDEIGELARQRTPRRLSKEWLRFEEPPARVPRFLVSPFVENNDEALKLAQAHLIPHLVRREPMAFDFVNVRVVTQSFAHALLFELLRFAWASQTPIYVVNAAPVVRSALHHVETYAQGG